MIKTELLKTLREQTGLSYSECTKALKEADNDIDKAKALLKKWGIAYAEKKTDREATEGGIFTYIHHNKKIGVMIELMCETDFVAKNDDFMTLGTDLAMQIASINPDSKEILMKSDFIKDPSLTVEDYIKQFIFKLGENINIGRFQRFSL